MLSTSPLSMSTFVRNIISNFFQLTFRAKKNPIKSCFWFIPVCSHFYIDTMTAENTNITAKTKQRERIRPAILSTCRVLVSVKRQNVHDWMKQQLTRLSISQIVLDGNQRRTELDSIWRSCTTHGGSWCLSLVHNFPFSYGWCDVVWCGGAMQCFGPSLL